VENNGRRAQLTSVHRCGCVVVGGDAAVVFGGGVLGGFCFLFDKRHTKRKKEKARRGKDFFPNFQSLKDSEDGDITKGDGKTVFPSHLKIHPFNHSMI
jgi:hypothetical protein